MTSYGSEFIGFMVDVSSDATLGYCKEIKDVCSDHTVICDVSALLLPNE